MKGLLAAVACLVGYLEECGALVDDMADPADRLVPEMDYPKLFSELIRCHSFTAFEVGGLTICSNLQGEECSLAALLRDETLTRALCEAGFAPFGRPSTGSYDRVCFDMRGTSRALDAPVVLMDHEAILSFGSIPQPRVIADGLLQLFEPGSPEAADKPPCR